MRGREYLWMAATATAYILGIGTGILFSKNWAQRKYKRIADEEIESVKQEFARQGETARPVENIPEDTARYSELLCDTGYSGEAPKTSHIISPDEFGELPDYNQISLTYFSDGVLADENYFTVDNTEELIGEGALDHFGEYEEDSVFVRNDRLKTDFEILLDTRRYSDVRRTISPM